MEFDALEFFTQSNDAKVQNKYFSFFRNGILLDVEPLYLLIVGRYDIENKTNFLKYQHFDKEDYDKFTRFFNSISNYPISITPHTFTKFIHLLLSIDPNHFYKIIETFLSQFEYIEEKYVHKNEIMKLEDFKTKHYDLNNASIILTSEKFKYNSIITCENKLKGICQKRGNFLVISYRDIKVAIQSLPSE